MHAQVMPPDTYRRRLWAVAIEQYGYVTTRDAADAGVPAVELRKLAHRGFLERTGRGLYRFPDVPVNERTEYMEAVLWAGEGAVLSHDAVLSLHGLGFANPSTIRVTIPRRVRKTHPRHDITLIQAELPDNDLTTYEGIPSTTVARALLDARGLLMPSRLREAAVAARDQGLLLAGEYDRVRTDLSDAQ
ncbi:type IV toxin-antitoxin system AbiEi family antitoxin domain-containing protein [soil metagenome]